MIEDSVYLEDIMYAKFCNGEITPMEYIRWLHNTSETDKKRVV
jgi:hypothetical protein